MSAAQSLKVLKQEFATWRKHKKSIRSPVPIELRRKVLALRSHVDDTALFSALDIRPSMLNSWSNKEENNGQNDDTQIEFVSLPSDVIESTVDTAATTTILPRLQLSCDTLDGNHWCLQGDVSPQQLSAFVHAVNGVSGGQQ